jgi:hypothetical protein
MNPKRRIVRWWISAAVGLLCLLSLGATWNYAPSPAEKQALTRISADSLRGHLSFLASDLLQGRPTPSMGQDVAAEYIAAQFRRAGLKPAGDDGYLQTFPNLVITPDPGTFQCRISVDGRELKIPANRFRIDRAQEVQVDNAPLWKVPAGGQLPDHVRDLAGKAVVAEAPAGGSMESFARRRQFIQRIAALKPSLLLEIDRTDHKDVAWSTLRSLKNEFSATGGNTGGIPVFTINDASAVQLYDALPQGETKAVLSLRLGTTETKWPLHNVIGLLPGSDPKISDTYVLVTAHYDGTGPRASSDPDQIWNAANDNGSGTVSVIEIASALASLEEKPRRSIVFIAFFGEEGGGFGSRYYGQHPAAPIERTVAMINLEQVGRTDSSEGDQKRRASLTGFDFSDLGEIFRRAGDLTGIKVYKHETNSDTYFSGSDNLMLAQLGVPAHTICVAFQFADYHGSGDEWSKIDYENMALTDRMIATAALIVAQSNEEPRWNESNSKTSRYVDAWKKHHPQ